MPGSQVKYHTNLAKTLPFIDDKLIGMNDLIARKIIRNKVVVGFFVLNVT